MGLTSRVPESTGLPGVQGNVQTARVVEEGWLTKFTETSVRPNRRWARRRVNCPLRCSFLGDVFPSSIERQPDVQLRAVPPSRIHKAVMNTNCKYSEMSPSLAEIVPEEAPRIFTPPD